MPSLQSFLKIIIFNQNLPKMITAIHQLDLTKSYTYADYLSC